MPTDETMVETKVIRAVSSAPSTLNQKPFTSVTAPIQEQDRISRAPLREICAKNQNQLQRLSSVPQARLVSIQNLVLPSGHPTKPSFIVEFSISFKQIFHFKEIIKLCL